MNKELILEILWELGVEVDYSELDTVIEKAQSLLAQESVIKKEVTNE